MQDIDLFIKLAEKFDTGQVVGAPRLVSFQHDVGVVPAFHEPVPQRVDHETWRRGALRARHRLL